MPSLLPFTAAATAAPPPGDHGQAGMRIRTFECEIIISVPVASFIKIITICLMCVPGGGRNSPKSCENYICIEIGCLNPVWQGRLGWVSHTSQRTKSGAQASFYRLARNATLQCELRKQHPVAPGTIFTPALRSKRMEYFSSFFWDFPGQVWGKSSFSVSKIVCARS